MRDKSRHRTRKKKKERGNASGAEVPREVTMTKKVQMERARRGHKVKRDN
jgi:hypothetical protein